MTSIASIKSKHTVEMEDKTVSEMISEEDHLRISDILNSDGTTWDKIEGVSEERTPGKQSRLRYN